MSVAHKLPEGVTITAVQPDVDSVAYSALEITMPDGGVKYLEYSQHGEIEYHAASATIADIIDAGYKDILYSDWSDADADELAEYARPDNLVQWVAEELYQACWDLDEEIEDRAVRRNVGEWREEYAEAVAFLVYSPRGFANEVLCFAIAMDKDAQATARQIADDYNNDVNAWARIELNNEDFWEYVETCAVDGRGATTSNPASGVTEISGWIYAGGMVYND